MAKINNIKYKILFEEKIPYWWRFAYLIPDPWIERLVDIDQFSAIVQGKNTKFGEYVQKYVKAFIEEGKMPPSTIAGTIINIAEDIMAGRKPTIRAGDYIAIQNEMRD
ncbi:MAG: hypothetical protein JXB88_20880 [Spirochaetales bacterium]|nr:hypothetical protein [Spirochaetales bacterium]